MKVEEVESDAQAFKRVTIQIVIESEEELKSMRRMSGKDASIPDVMHPDDQPVVRRFLTGIRDPLQKAMHERGLTL